MAINQDQQAAFIDLLQEGYVLTAEDITAVLLVRNPAKFVKQVIDRTGLDIYQGKIMIGEIVRAVYFMISDITPESPGLDGMSEVVEISTPEDHKIIEYQRGHYLMWICPYSESCGSDDEGTTYSKECGQFHKVDLGDEPLTRPRTVRCIRCGSQYQVKPISWR